LPKFGLQAFMKGFCKGLAEGAANYGLLIEGFQVALVNGFWYQQLVPFGATHAPSKPPPRLALWLVTRVHPAFRKRIRMSQRAFSEKAWRKDLATWDEVDRPRAIASHRLLLSVDERSLEDAALVGHLRACEAHMEDMSYLHQKYTVPSLAPIGDLLAHVFSWTGREPFKVLDLTRGASPVSLGFATRELELLGSAIRKDPTARALLEAHDEWEALEALLALEGPVGEATRTFVELVRYRALSYDVGERLVGELPQMLVRSVRAAVDGRVLSAPNEDERWACEIREAIPMAKRTEFDELLAETRLMSRLRDERGMYAECWALGIARRALLEAGKRLVLRGRLHDRGHAVDLTMPELEALLGGKPGPSADEVRGRATFRITHTVADCPPHLGPPPAALVEPELLPFAARRSARALAAVVVGMFGETNAISTPEVIRGLSASRGVYEGTARNVDGPSEFDRVQRHDVLVTRATAPYFNAILPLLGAIVTDRGGQLSHAAIVAREYGIPAVVGTKQATVFIPDGARVRVDGTRGEVTIL
jgi:pyruvate,water dikinase